MGWMAPLRHLSAITAAAGRDDQRRACGHCGEEVRPSRVGTLISRQWQVGGEVVDPPSQPKPQFPRNRTDLRSIGPRGAAMSSRRCLCVAAWS